jgi:hypothetical protein
LATGIVAAALTVAGAAVLALPVLTACGPPPANCGSVGFAPNTDWGAFDIQATNASCSTAGGVAAGSKQAGTRSYAGFGWICIAGRTSTEGLPTTPYRCAGPYGGVVTFGYS